MHSRCNLFRDQWSLEVCPYKSKIWRFKSQSMHSATFLLTAWPFRYDHDAMKNSTSLKKCLSGWFMLVLIISILKFVVPLHAEEMGTLHTYNVQPTTSAIKIDGVLDEAIYKAPPTFTLNYETYPGDNTPALVKTEMWITYDGSRLIVGVRAQDPNPAEIRARLQDRDKAYQDDF